MFRRFCRIALPSLTGLIVVLMVQAYGWVGVFVRVWYFGIASNPTKLTLSVWDHSRFGIVGEAFRPNPPESLFCFPSIQNDGDVTWIYLPWIWCLAAWLCVAVGLWLLINRDRRKPQGFPVVT
jgi:hypothetical protein